MKTKEVAVFRFKEDCLEGAVALNKELLSEMQAASNNSLLEFEVLQSIKQPNVFTWLVDWTNAESAKETTDKWLSFPSNKKFSSSVEKDVFYDFLEVR
jgi:quinol monooxygenase YgiN